MNTIERAWTAFMAAIDEARDLHQCGSDASELSELWRHARELLDILEDEAAAQSIEMPPAAHGILTNLRGSLESWEKDVAATQH